MKLYGLLGKSLIHSFSKNYFTEKFVTESITDCVYELFEIEGLNDLNTILSQPNLKGLNVTIPYKEDIIKYLDDIDSIAKGIGAVNTIKVNNGQLIGYNTDYYGFKKSLKPFLDINHNRALILGTGGASKAVAYVLKELNINCLFVSRTPKNSNEISYNDINEYVIKHHQIIINATPIGTFPNINNFPKLCYDKLTPEHLLYDLVYNPLETEFLKKGKLQGCITINGLQMLKLQAEKSWEIWNT